MLKRFFDKVREIYSASTISGASGEAFGISTDMENAINLWNDIYKNNASWLWDNTDMKSLNLGAAIAGEFARLVTLEFESKVTEEGIRGEFINSTYQRFLKELRKICERACALGGVCLKPICEGGKIFVDVVDPLDFYPIESNDEGVITGAVFLAHKTIGKIFYTKLEVHKFSLGRETVHSRCFKSYTEGSLDIECSLSEVAEWAEIVPEFTVENIAGPLFVYFKMPMANNIDERSPLGISVFSGATELLRDADEQYTRYLWEFEGGELAIDAESTALKLTEKDKGLPRHNKRVFEKLFRGHNTGQDDFYKAWTPTLRNESLESGLNTIERKIEFVCSLAYGTISDANDVDKTAEEIRSSKQRSYSAVVQIQKALEDALRELCYIIGVWGSIYGFCPWGKVPQMSFCWDDSIVADRAQEFTERSQLARDGVIKHWELRAWYLGEDEETAKRMCGETDLLE